ncbi:MAG TPA: ATP synthase F0 subunit B [Terriglobales bacterium]|nr:ATP synthase F0 subunit B [Terriglobales bacterium]
MTRVAHCWSMRLLLCGFIAAFCMVPLSAHGSSGRLSASTSFASYHQTASQPAQDSREAAGEDDQAQFKHSASVQILAKLTGMSLEHAYWLGVSLNFAIVAGILIWAARKYLPDAFRNRTASIQKAIEEARKTSEEANRRLTEIESRLSKLDTEIAGMRARAEKEAVLEEAKIKAAAEEEARRIVESAEQEISAAAKMARRELKVFAADLAVSLATNNIRIDQPTDQALVRGFAQQLPGNDGRKDRQ